jgi:hypothetical protein
VGLVMDDAFKRLEELVAVPEKRKRVFTPEQEARRLEATRRYRAKNRVKALEASRRSIEKNRDAHLATRRRKRAENLEKSRDYESKKKERKAADSELFAINQAEQYARIGNVTRDITANCPEPTRSKLQALVDQIKADPSAGKQVIGLLRNMRELRKLELAEQQQATETETEN